MPKITKAIFQNVEIPQMDCQILRNHKVKSYWAVVFQRFKKNKPAMLGVYLILLIVIMVVFGPVLSHHSYSDQNLSAANLPPSPGYWFGTDHLGRDVFIRVLYGARISLAVGFFSSIINLTIGVVYGGVSGLIGGWVDNLMMRIVEMIYAIPLTLYVILLMVVFDAGLKNVFIAIGIVYWLETARIVRGQVISLKERDYVVAARSMGAGRFHILFKHLIPNCIGPVMVTMSFNIPAAIFTEAFLSFIGLGVSAPMASLGTLVNDALLSIWSYPWQVLFPSAAITVIILAFNLIGDGLKDAFDPRYYQ
ncbi:MAG: oligopeptide transport system permease protein [Thermosediminibacterales bacterium]|nr:oligopeptide transport system permease protein [Thermosediminibacterales bacterium]MDK2836423.1 oligopeptide transport system permease protein [Thermosediminibacterales bacterium]